MIPSNPPGLQMRAKLLRIPQRSDRVRRARAVWRAALVVGAVGVAAFLSPAGDIAHAAPDSLPANCEPSADELPDLCPSLPTHTIDNGQEPFLEVLSDGTRRYRTDLVIWDAGGALELEGRDCTQNVVCNEVWQRIWEGDGEPGGPSRTERIPGRLIFDVGDGHNHFHIENAARMEIVVPGGTNLVGAKVAYCLFDTTTPATARRRI